MSKSLHNQSLFVEASNDIEGTFVRTEANSIYKKQLWKPCEDENLQFLTCHYWVYFCYFKPKQLLFHSKLEISKSVRVLLNTTKSESTACYQRQALKCMALPSDSILSEFERR